MTVPRETKSWTWVNERACPECGFDASSVEANEVADLLTANLEDWRLLLATDDPGRAARLAVRPDPSTWSPLEYACHVRDVLELLAYRFERTLAEDRPTFEDWHPDDRAELGRYQDERSADDVLDAMVARSQRAVDLARSLDDHPWDDGWGRRGVRADGLEFTNAFLATYLTHDVVHHVHDVERILG